MQRMHTVGLALGWLVLVAAGPAEPGTEVGGGAGGQRYAEQRVYPGCGGVRYRYELAGPLGHAAARHTWESGVTAAADATLAPVQVVERELLDWGTALVPSDLAVPAAGSWEPGLLGSARLGWHGRYLGAELGPGLWWHGQEVQVLPGATAWVGVPRVVYAYGGMLRGGTLGPTRVLDLGLGHRGDLARVELGRTAGLQPGWSWVLRAAFPLGQGWWAGGEVSLLDHADLPAGGSGSLTLSRDL